MSIQISHVDTNISLSQQNIAATSALDSASEHHVKEAIDSAMKGRTVLSIAHRLSTIQQSDRIAVLKDGAIAEVGTYAELVDRKDGAFRELMGRQLVLDE